MLRTKTLIFLAFGVLITFSGYAQESVDDAENFTVSKGRYYNSLSFSLDQRKAENENQLLREVINQDRLNYRILLNGGYALKDNLTVGLLANYGRSKEEITYLGDNDTEVRLKRLQQGLTLSPNMRNYISIGNGQFQILVQTEFGLTLGESLQREFFPEEVNKTELDFLEIELGVSPGLVLFFDRNWAFETTVGLVGFSTRIEEEVTNDKVADRQRIVESSIDLRINILQLNLGVARYF